MWQVTLRNGFEDFNRKLEKFKQSESDKQQRQMLSVKIAVEEKLESGLGALDEYTDGPNESIVRLSDCIEHISKQLYRNLD